MAEKRSIQVSEEMLQDLRCPVCLEVPQTTPIYQCCEGHIHCKDCHPMLQNCPICRSSIGETRALMVEKMVASLSSKDFEKEESESPKSENPATFTKEAKENKIAKMRKNLSKWFSKFNLRSKNIKPGNQTQFESPQLENRNIDRNRFADKLEADISSVLGRYGGLKKETVVNVYHCAIIILSGTIQVPFRGQFYLIRGVHSYGAER